MTPQDQLLAAADYIAQNGHTKETYFEITEGQTAACALGALAKAAPNMIDNWGGVESSVVDLPAARMLAEQIADGVPHLKGMDVFNTVTLYNDDDRTTAEDVILMMKKAAHG